MQRTTKCNIPPPVDALPKAARASLTEWHFNNGHSQLLTIGCQSSKSGARHQPYNVPMPLNLKAVNAELAKRGFKATLAKGEGYFYFQGGDVTGWLDRTVRVATLHSLSLEQWIGSYRELKAKNETLLKVQIKSKELKTRRTQRAAGDSKSERPGAPYATKQRDTAKSVSRVAPVNRRRRAN